jgi:hypothetical protein
LEESFLFGDDHIDPAIQFFAVLLDGFAYLLLAVWRDLAVLLDLVEPKGNKI